jgi:hypothetical protein
MLGLFGRETKRISMLNENICNPVTEAFSLLSIINKFTMALSVLPERGKQKILKKLLQISRAYELWVYSTK